MYYARHEIHSASKTIIFYKHLWKVLWLTCLGKCIKVKDVGSNSHQCQCNNACWALAFNEIRKNNLKLELTFISNVIIEFIWLILLSFFAMLHVFLLHLFGQLTTRCYRPFQINLHQKIKNIANQEHWANNVIPIVELK